MTNRICFGIVFLAALAVVGPAVAIAQPQLILAGGPIQVFAGEHVVVCATNYGARAVTATLEYMDALTSGLISPQTVILPAANGNGLVTTTCQTIVVTKATDILLGLVKVTGQPPALTGFVQGSLQVFAVASSNALMNPRYVALGPISPNPASLCGGQ